MTATIVQGQAHFNVVFAARSRSFQEVQVAWPASHTKLSSALSASGQFSGEGCAPVILL